MKQLNFQSRDEWLEARRGKITGSRLKDIVVKRGKGKKLGFYELIAERIAIPADDENPMDRGTRLEEEAIARYEKETGKKVDSSLMIWTRDDDESIAVSPDGYIAKDNIAVECKCLGSARHIQAYLEKTIPDEYIEQMTQYFIVNETLKKVVFCFYDPRIPCKDFFTIEIFRKEVEEEIKFLLDYQRQTLTEVNEVVNKLTF